MANVGTSRGDARRDWLLTRPDARGRDRELRPVRDEEARRPRPERPASREGERPPPDGRRSDPDDAGPQKSGGDGPKPEARKPLPKWPFVLAAAVVLGFVGVVLWLIFRPRPDAYLVLGGVTVVMMAVLLLLPVRTLPPRLQLARS